MDIPPLYATFNKEQFEYSSYIGSTSSGKRKKEKV
jgi:hypothetical protein